MSRLPSFPRATTLVARWLIRQPFRSANDLRVTRPSLPVAMDELSQPRMMVKEPTGIVSYDPSAHQLPESVHTPNTVTARLPHWSDHHPDFRRSEHRPALPPSGVRPLQQAPGEPACSGASWTDQRAPTAPVPPLAKSLQPAEGSNTRAVGREIAPSGVRPHSTSAG